MNVVCQTRWLSFAHTHAQTERPLRESARQRGWTTHQHLYSLQPRHIKAFSAHLSVCVPVNQKAYFEHAHTHTGSDCICFVQQRPGLGRGGKGFCCRRGNYSPQLTLSGKRGGWLFTRSEWEKERKGEKKERRNKKTERSLLCLRLCFLLCKSPIASLSPLICPCHHHPKVTHTYTRLPVF